MFFSGSIYPAIQPPITLVKLRHCKAIYSFLKVPRNIIPGGKQINPYVVGDWRHLNNCLEPIFSVGVGSG